MSTKTKTIEGNNLNKSSELSSAWSRAIKSKSEWPDKEEFLDVIYWARQAIGIILGLSWGVIPLQGFMGLLLFVLVNAGIIYIYVTSFQNIDEEEYGGVWELTKEGFMTSFAGFLPCVANFLQPIFRPPLQGSSSGLMIYLVSILKKTPAMVVKILVEVTWIIMYTGLHYDSL